MKVLIYEDPKEHGIEKADEIRINIGNHCLETKVEIARDLQTAKRVLSEDKWTSKEIKMVVIHHHSWEAVEQLRSMYPEQKYAAVHGNIADYMELIEGDHKSKRRSLAVLFLNRLREKYDHLVAHYFYDLIKPIKAMEKGEN